MADRLIRLEVVTPEEIVFSEDVYCITVPGLLGELGVLPGHIPIVTDLAIGTVTYKLDSGEAHKIFVGGGFLEVMDNKAVILAKVAERGSEIDRARAEEALHRAEDRLTHKEDPDIDLIRATIAMKKASQRIKSAE